MTSGIALSYTWGKTQKECAAFIFLDSAQSADPRL